MLKGWIKGRTYARSPFLGRRGEAVIFLTFQTRPLHMGLYEVNRNLVPVGYCRTRQLEGPGS